MSRKNKFDDYIKANRKGSRLAELENETGFVSKHKVHKNKKKRLPPKKVDLIVEND